MTRFALRPHSREIEYDSHSRLWAPTASPTSLRIVDQLLQVPDGSVAQTLQNFGLTPRSAQAPLRPQRAWPGIGDRRRGEKRLHHLRSAATPRIDRRRSASRAGAAENPPPGFESNGFVPQSRRRADGGQGRAEGAPDQKAQSEWVTVGLASSGDAREAAAGASAPPVVC